MDDIVIRSLNDIVEPVVAHVRHCLRHDGIAQFRIDEGYGPKRAVIAWWTVNDTNEDPDIMMAMEGSGCFFCQPRSVINPFNLISAGFNLTAAQIMCVIVLALARHREQGHDYALLEDRRS